jgi:hypothetical protein
MEESAPRESQPRKGSPRPYLAAHERLALAALLSALSAFLRVIEAIPRSHYWLRR